MGSLDFPCKRRGPAWLLRRHRLRPHRRFPNPSCWAQKWLSLPDLAGAAPTAIADPAEKDGLANELFDRGQRADQDRINQEAAGCGGRLHGIWERADHRLLRLLPSRAMISPPPNRAGTAPGSPDFVIPGRERRAEQLTCHRRRTERRPAGGYGRRWAVAEIRAAQLLRHKGAVPAGSGDEPRRST